MRPETDEVSESSACTEDENNEVVIDPSPILE